MKISSKHIGIIIGLLAFVILTSGCISIDNPLSSISIDDPLSSFTNSPTKTFTGYGVSFEYPSSWYVYPDNTTGNNVIMATKEVGFNNVQFQVQIMPNNGMPEKSAVKEFRESYTPGWNKVASYKLTIDNKAAYEDMYTVNDTHFSKLMRMSQIILVKNDKSYLMLLQAPEDEFDKERANFNVILNSFKVD